MGTKVSLLKANNRQDPKMEFKMRKKRKYEGVEKFAERMREDKGGAIKGTGRYEAVCRQRKREHKRIQSG